MGLMARQTRADTQYKIVPSLAVVSDEQLACIAQTVGAST